MLARVCTLLLGVAVPEKGCVGSGLSRLVVGTFVYFGRIGSESSRSNSAPPVTECWINPVLKCALRSVWLAIKPSMLLEVSSIAVDDDGGERRGQTGNRARGGGGQNSLRLSDADVAVVAGIAALVTEREVRAEIVLDADGGDIVASAEIVATVLEAVIVVSRDGRRTVEEPRDPIVWNVVGLLIEAADDDAGWCPEAEGKRRSDAIAAVMHEPSCARRHRLRCP